MNATDVMNGVESSYSSSANIVIIGVVILAVIFIGAYIYSYFNQ